MNKYDKVWKEIRKEVSAYTSKNPTVKSADRNTLLKLMGMFSLFATFFILGLNGESSLKSYLFLIFAGISLVLFIINTAHDASHNVLFKNQKLNKFFQIFPFFFMGIDGKLWQLRHIHSHHKDTNIHDHDPDILENSFLRLSPTNKKKKIFRWQYLYAPVIYSIVLSHTFLIKDFIHLMDKNLDYTSKIKSKKVAWLRAISIKLLYILLVIVLPVMLLDISIYWAILCLLILHISASSFFALTVSLNHFVEKSKFYKERPDISWFEHHLHTSNDWNPQNKYLTNIMGGVNTHLAHHLFPSISHSKYFEVSEIIYAVCEKHKIEIHTNTFASGIRSHYRFLKALGR